MVNGNRSDLKSEEATTWTFGIDFQPAAFEGFSAKLTYFDIDYKSRIATPYASLNSNDLSYHDYPLPLPAVGAVDWDQVNAWVAAAPYEPANYTGFFPGGSNSTLEDVTLIIDQRTTNTSRSRSSGLDLLLNQIISRAGGQVSATLAGSYLIESSDQFSPIRPVVDNVGLIFKPARLRGNAGLSYSSDGGWAAQVVARYVDSYKDDMVVGTPAKVDAWLTLDLSVNWSLGQRFGAGLLSGTRLSLSVRNVLDEDPPSVTLQPSSTSSARWFTYDPANADPEGRSIAVTFVKEW